MLIQKRSFKENLIALLAFLGAYALSNFSWFIPFSPHIP